MNPPTKNSGQLTKLYFMTQVGVRPPSFVIKANATGVLHFSYVRFLENRLREQFGFHGTPLRIAVKKKGTREDEAEEVAKVRQVISPKLGIKPSKKTLSHKRNKPRVGSPEKRSPSYRGSLRPRRKKKT